MEVVRETHQDHMKEMEEIVEDTAETEVAHREEVLPEVMMTLRFLSET